MRASRGWTTTGCRCDRSSSTTRGTRSRRTGRFADDPERLLLRKEDCARVDAALGALPPVFREVLVLREFEELSYDAIARVAGIPIGTVMSRLSRGRAMLRAALTEGNAR